MDVEINLEKMNVSQLKQFLKERGKRSSGNKLKLLELAKLYIHSPVLSDSTLSQTSFDEIFDNTSISWNEVSKAMVPTNFSIENIHSYLSDLSYVQIIDNGEDEEIIDSSTEKPAVKGRRLYLSSKIQVFESCMRKNDVLFRATIEASMRSNVFR